MSNTTGLSNDSVIMDFSVAGPIARLAFGLVLSTVLNIVVVGGNLLTLFCFVIDRHIRRNQTNYFVGSLAMADLALGLFVLPPFIAAEWMESWPFGNIPCRIWLLVDIWLYTSSIYSLIAIAIDRYWAILRPLKHKSLQTHARAMTMILWAWSLSFAIAVPSLFFGTPLSHGRCTLMLHSSVYIMYSAVGSFYLPMVVLLYLYINIYRTVRKIKLNGTVGIVQTMDVSASSFFRSITDHPGINGAFNRKRYGSDDTILSTTNSTSDSIKRQMSQCLRVHRGGYHQPVSNTASFSPSHRTASKNPSFSPPLSPMNRAGSLPISVESTALLHKNGHSHGHARLYESVSHFVAKKHMAARNCRKKLLLEFRAVRMIALVTTAFFLCWAGFFILCTWNAFVNLPSPSDPENAIIGHRSVAPNWIIDAVTWLGYVNSAIDPLIYAVSNRRFKKTFKRVLRVLFACYW